MLAEVRKSLLDEARQSPELLSDLAGLEQYVAESYDARSFVELLQNADDSGAARFAIQRVGEFLLVANDGREFTEADFESLCRSAASSKHRGTSIGYRGIGFKSVVGIAKAIHLFSGQLEATFSRELTAKEIPQAKRVPLVRIPHLVEPELRNQLGAAVNQLRDNGFKTVFAFGDLIASGIEAEFAAFDQTSLLFLRHIREAELKSKTDATITVQRESVDARTRSVRLTTPEATTQWTVIGREGVALALVHDESGIARLDERQAVVHAFLPTLEASGFPFKINGDISTDPSRTRVIFDERTAAGISAIAKLMVDLMSECLDSSSAKAEIELLAGLMPNSDPRMASFQRRGFKSELYAAIKREAKNRFAGFLCRPAWLNAADFTKLADAAGIKAVARHLDAVEGLPAFLKFLGAREAVFKDFSFGLDKCAPSSVGAAEVVAHLTNLYATKQVKAEAVKPEWKLWQVGNKIIALTEARQQAKPLATDFLDRVAEKSCSHVELGRLLIALTDRAATATLIPEQLLPENEKNSAAKPMQRLPNVSLKRWRSAEQQVFSLLQAWGWVVLDVSRQNIGYDIEGKTNEGEDAFIEVKSLDNPGQTFTLTSNEEVVARQKGKAYRLALVYQAGDHLEVAFIEDPIHKLKLTRQCRQWAWECSAYDFIPTKIPLD